MISRYLGYLPTETISSRLKNRLMRTTKSVTRWL